MHIYSAMKSWIFQLRQFFINSILIKSFTYKEIEAETMHWVNSFLVVTLFLQISSFAVPQYLVKFSPDKFAVWMQTLLNSWCLSLTSKHWPLSGQFSVDTAMVLVLLAIGQVILHGSVQLWKFPFGQLMFSLVLLHGVVLQQYMFLFWRSAPCKFCEPHWQLSEFPFSPRHLSPQISSEIRKMQILNKIPEKSIYIQNQSIQHVFERVQMYTKLSCTIQKTVWFYYQKLFDTQLYINLKNVKFIYGAFLYIEIHF